MPEFNLAHPITPPSENGQHPAPTGTAYEIPDLDLMPLPEYDEQDEWCNGYDENAPFDEAAWGLR